MGRLAGGSGGTVVLGNGVLTVNQAGPSSFDGLVTGARGLKIEGGGTLALGNAANDYGAGTTVIEGSTVSIACGWRAGQFHQRADSGRRHHQRHPGDHRRTSPRHTFVAGETGGGRVDVADGTTATLTERSAASAS